MAHHCQRCAVHTRVWIRRISGGAGFTNARLQGPHLGGAQPQDAHLFDAQLLLIPPVRRVPRSRHLVA
jgi:hypothetical protein